MSEIRAKALEMAVRTAETHDPAAIVEMARAFEIFLGGAPGPEPAPPAQTGVVTITVDLAGYPPQVTHIPWEALAAYDETVAAQIVSEHTIGLLKAAAAQVAI